MSAHLGQSYKGYRKGNGNFGEAKNRKQKLVMLKMLFMFCIFVAWLVEEDDTMPSAVTIYENNNFVVDVLG